MSNKPKEEKNIDNFNINSCQCVEEFAKKGLTEIMEATKCVSAFPQGANRDLYCAYSAFGQVIDQQSHRLLGLISHVLKGQNVRGNIERRQPDEQFDLLLECNDAIFERLQTNLDELEGIKKNPQTIVVETRMNGIKPYNTSTGAGSLNLKAQESLPSVTARLITAKNIARPQVKFQIPVDNSAETPFIPKLKNKPNSLKPLAILPEYDDAGNVVSYLHPYEFELMKFEVPESMLKPKEPQTPETLEKTELVYVDTVAKLKQVLEELRQVSELAIDVEHHSYRSFLGFTCLVQISTRYKDYIFDALELREDLHILNEILTDARVVKIFHGADLDIEWLQRDLSLYVVNMFDTHQASKALNFARLSLAYLLKHFCDLDVDKTFQLADWRIRPLPTELLAYARQDTHYLIYIYERLTNDLLQAANQQPHLLRNIYQRSTELCKKRYIKPVLLIDSHLDLYRKSKKLFDNRQLYALEKIFHWRDTVARQEDESFSYVLPNHMMLQIAESLPREMQGILACCNPIPPLVRQQMHTLHQIILKAREQPLVKLIPETEIIHRQFYNNVKDYNSKLHCPHDLTHAEEFRDDLHTLITFNKGDLQFDNTVSSLNAEIPNFAKAKLSIFDEDFKCEEERDILLYNQKKRQRLLEPYFRYLAVLPMVKKEKLEEAALIEAENRKRQLCPSACVDSMNSTKEEEQSRDVKNNEEDKYTLPIREMLKRKHEEAKANSNTDTPPRAKRIKTEQPITNDMEPVCNKLKFVNLPPTKKELKKQRQPNSSSRQKKTNDAIVVVDDDLDGPPEEKPIATEMIDLTVNTSGKSKNKRKNKIKKWLKNVQSKSYQTSDKPVNSKNFDYKNVDFSKFKGGAQKVSGTEIKQQFHGKGNSNKTQNKKFNKLFTFSNVKCNKK